MNLEQILVEAIDQTGDKVGGFISVEDAPALLQAIQDAGYVIVPREPTEAMVDAAHDDLQGMDENPYSTWAAMIAAFPTANPSS